MICPYCLEEYEFMGFEVDPRSLEHRGIFKCECKGEIVFPESLTLEMMEDNDLLERLHISRRFHMGLRLAGKRQERSVPKSEMISVHTRNLEKYLRHFSEKQMRLFK